MEKDEIRFDIGSVFIVQDRYVILVQTSSEKFCLIDLNTGNRLDNPMEVKRGLTDGIPQVTINVMADSDRRGFSAEFVGRFKKSE